MGLFGFETGQLLSFAVVAILAYVTSVSVYRLFLHPLSHLPGPKLAHLTHLYEWYYDLYLHGQYTFKLRELHDKYGLLSIYSPATISMNSDTVGTRSHHTNQP